MSRSAREFDDLIREALADSDVEESEQLEAQSMAELLTDTFRGQNRRLAIGGAVVNLALFVLGLWSALSFVRAPDVQASIGWALLVMICFSAVGMIKIWYWLEMNRLAVTREVKRVELHVVQLAQRITERGSEEAS